MRNKLWLRIILTSIFCVGCGLIGFAQSSAPLLNQYLHRDADGDVPYQNGYLKEFLPDKAVIEDDFFSFFGIDESSLTPLKRKMMEETEEFQSKRAKFQNLRANMRDKLCHIEYGFYGAIYDLDKGGFKISLNIEWRGLRFFIPQNLRNKLRIYDEETLNFFIPIRNLEEALKIEDGEDYSYVLQFSYFPVNNPHQEYYFNNDVSDLTFKVNDIYMYKRSTGEIVWSALLGDQSEKLRTENTIIEKMRVEKTNPEEILKHVEQPKEIEKTEPEKIYQAVDQPPAFPGGELALMKWLSSNIRYPEGAQQNGTQGRVIVKFVIEKDGSVSDVKVAKGVDKDLDNEAVRIVKRMPKWQPGKNHGQAVRTEFNLPVTFNLQTQ